MSRALPCLPLAAAGALLLIGALALPTPGQSARSESEQRALNMIHNHTGEHIYIVYKRDGAYDREALKKINWFLRDWRKNEAIEMDPRLLDLMWEAARDLNARTPIRIICGYRSPGTNDMLRARSSGVAKHSQHTEGKAIDIAIPDVPTASLREIGMLKQKGGVGFYPKSGTPFVHLDVGSVRAWPRMSTQQLVRLFPSGETLHLPSDGPPLSGYSLALAKLGRDGKRGERMLAFADFGAAAPRGILRSFDQAARDEPMTVAALPPALSPGQPKSLLQNAGIPVPLPRPAALMQFASLPAPKLNLATLHYDTRMNEGFFKGDAGSLQAPQLRLAAIYLAAPADAEKSAVSRKWTKVSANFGAQLRLANSL